MFSSDPEPFELRGKNQKINNIGSESDRSEWSEWEDAKIENIWRMCVRSFVLCWCGLNTGPLLGLQLNIHFWIKCAQNIPKRITTNSTQMYALCCVAYNSMKKKKSNKWMRPNVWAADCFNCWMLDKSNIKMRPEWSHSYSHSHIHTARRAYNVLFLLSHF